MIELDRDPEELQRLMERLNVFIAENSTESGVDQTLWLAQLGDRLVLHTYAIRDRLADADWGRALIGLQLLLKMTARAIDVVAQEGAVGSVDFG